MAHQNREFERLDSKNLLNYSCFDKDGKEAVRGMGRTMDISPKGICLETHVSVEPYKKITLTIGLADDLVDLSGKIIYSRKGDNGKFHTGIEFKEKDANAQKILKQFIKELEKKS